jgi:uncharacterized UBP type Zn finger protein
MKQQPMANDDPIDLSLPCSHITPTMPRSLHRPPAGCEDCIKSGGQWVHLRVCLTCGHVGCCDSSPNRHATAHNRQTGHPVVASGELGETWAYCYPHDQVLSEG